MTGTQVCGRFIGWVWLNVLRVRVSTVRENLQLVPLGKKLKNGNQFLKENFIYYGTMIAETFLLPFRSRDYFLRRVVMSDQEFLPFQQSLDQGKGAFLLTAHLGNWETMCHFGAYRGLKITVVTKTFKSRFLQWLWFRLRQHPGVRYLDVEGTALEALARVRRGEFVAMMLDQHMQPPIGVETRFMGRNVGSIRSLALLALRSGVPVIPVYCALEKDGYYHVHTDPVIHPDTFLSSGAPREELVQKMTQVFCDCIETWVEKFPEQWLWLHRRFKLSHDYGACENAFSPP